MRGRFPNPEQLDGILKTLDTDNSGVIDYSEFMDDPRGGPDSVPIRVCQAHHSSLRARPHPGEGSA